MDTDTLIALALALIAASLGYLGLRVTMHPIGGKDKRRKRKYHVAIVILTAASIPFVYWQARRSRIEKVITQRELEAKNEPSVFVAYSKKRLNFCNVRENIVRMYAVQWGPMLDTLGARPIKLDPGSWNSRDVSTWDSLYCGYMQSRSRAHLADSLRIYVEDALDRRFILRYNLRLSLDSTGLLLSLRR